MIRTVSDSHMSGFALAIRFISREHASTSIRRADAMDLYPIAK